MKSPVTSVDVARLAQVSQSAVSRTFTPGASVAEATRAKVLAAARKLGYRPNAHARSLITGRSRIIGLVLSYFENLFISVAMEQLAKRLQRDGYHILMFVADKNNADDLIGEVLQYNVDGIVLADATLSSTLAGLCANADIPVVLFNRVMSSSIDSTVSSVRSDNVEGGRLVAAHFVGRGKRRIAYIAGQEESSTNLERERGFREELARHGQRIFARAVGNYNQPEACQATHELFGLAGERPDAVFVASDYMAFSVMDVLRHELGLRVPEDVCVVGYDDVPQAQWQSYQLSTVRQSVPDMVEAAVGLLHGYLRDADHPQPANDVVVPVELILRTSSPE
ncbi:LacI family DNA-binding transcriptional regulator [Paraburkholderia sacchari]|uniref:LacI family DNA-binding transcriptional regulator n=1 Tax=Paraburkholderia sacchari TaxID=159450 RepID=UPI001BCD9DCD|nr:LacI family DNA-binding transcriptional regulator [Paraburkholderia sacchari]